MISEAKARMRVTLWVRDAMDGHSVAEVARAMGVRWNTADDWRTGDSVPGAVMLVRLSAFTRHPLEEL